jgi:hypothetical protein
MGGGEGHEGVPRSGPEKNSKVEISENDGWSKWLRENSSKTFFGSLLKTFFYSFASFAGMSSTLYKTVAPDF